MKTLKKMYIVESDAFVKSNVVKWGVLDGPLETDN